jgi:hypothetical protein
MRHRGRSFALIGLVSFAACAHNVAQDKATGEDGRQKGAKPIVLENGEGRDRGIVTYPGGDRVDWKRIDLPQGQRGKLDLQIRWKTPRPGLQVAFDVFDEWNAPIAATKAMQRKGGRIRSVTIDDARGKYFVRVYAPKRGDAGQYTLIASFTTNAGEEIPDIKKIPIDDPPPLPPVPPVEPACDVFDPKIDACRKVCPDYGAPPGWKACEEREKKKAADEAAKAAELARKECMKNAPKPVLAEVKHVEIVGDVVRIKLGVGTSAQPTLDAKWTGEVMIGTSNRALVGGQARVVGVDKLLTRAEVRLKVDQLSTNPWVRLTPPPPVCP